MIPPPPELRLLSQTTRPYLALYPIRPRAARAPARASLSPRTTTPPHVPRPGRLQSGCGSRGPAQARFLAAIAPCRPVKPPPCPALRRSLLPPGDAPDLHLRLNASAPAPILSASETPAPAAPRLRREPRPDPRAAQPQPVRRIARRRRPVRCWQRRHVGCGSGGARPSVRGVRREPGQRRAEANVFLRPAACASEPSGGAPCHPLLPLLLLSRSPPKVLPPLNTHSSPDDAQARRAAPPTSPASPRTRPSPAPSHPPRRPSPAPPAALPTPSSARW